MEIISTVDSLYLEHSLSRTNSQVPCEFEIVRVNCMHFCVSVT